MANTLRAYNAHEIDKVLKKVHKERGGLLKQCTPLPKTLSLRIMSNSDTSAYIAFPTTQNKVIGEGDNYIYDSTIKLILFNLSFLKSKGLISLDPKKYIVSRNAKLKPGAVKNLTTQSVCLNTDYEFFREQVAEVIKNNLSFIAPTSQDLPDKIRTSYEREFKNNNPNNIYGICKTEESKLYVQKLFLHLLREYISIRDNKDYLLDLYKEILSIISKSNTQDKTI